jgi:hypothetical protein
MEENMVMDMVTDINLIKDNEIIIKNILGIILTPNIFT